MTNTEGRTVGEILRAAREDKKLSIEQVNRETKISTQWIHALEEDEHGSFPGETYLKSSVRSYATFLGLDPNRLWSMVGSRRGGGEGASPRWDVEEALREEKLGPPRVLKRVILPVLVILVIVLVVLLVREKRRADRLTGSAADSYVEIVSTAG